MPEKIKLIVSDFDGVITDNRVWTDQDGKETVAASRSDSMRIRELREQGHRSDDPFIGSQPGGAAQGEEDGRGSRARHRYSKQGRGVARTCWLEKRWTPAQCHLHGNDFNDLPCFEIAGWAVAVADAYPEVLRAADHVLQAAGGHGALRELCDLVLNKS